MIPEFVAYHLNQSLKPEAKRGSEIHNLHRSIWNKIGPIHQQRANTPIRHTIRHALLIPSRNIA